MAGISADANQAPAHFGSSPAGGVSGDFNFPACHAAAEVSTGVACDKDFTGLHPGTDPVHCTAVTVEYELQV